MLWELCRFIIKDTSRIYATSVDKYLVYTVNMQPPHLPELQAPVHVTNTPELLTLSYSDVRRIAATRARDNLQQFLKKQAALIPKGQWRLSDTHSSSLMPILTSAHLKALTLLWDQVVKFSYISGANMIEYLQQNCRKREPGQESATHRSSILKTTERNMRMPRSDQVKQEKVALIEQRVCHTRPWFGPEEDLRRRRQAGQLLVYHVTDLLSNLKQKATLREMVGKKLDLLLKMGLTPDRIQALAVCCVQFLKERYPRYWSRAVEQASSIVLKCLRTLANEHLASRLPRSALFKDPVTNMAYNPSSSI